MKYFIIKITDIDVARYTKTYTASKALAKSNVATIYSVSENSIAAVEVPSPLWTMDAKYLFSMCERLLIKCPNCDKWEELSIDEDADTAKLFSVKDTRSDGSALYYCHNCGCRTVSEFAFGALGAEILN